MFDRISESNMLVKFKTLAPVCHESLVARHNLPLAPEELAVVLDLYDAHSGPTGMHRYQFNHFLLEVLSYTFLCRKRSKSALRHIRKCAIDGRLTVPTEGASFFDRMWSYFSPAKQPLAMPDFARAMARTCSTDANSRRHFMYYMLTAESDKVTQSVMESFLVSLVAMRGTLQIQVLRAERPFLMHEGIPGGTITRQSAEAAEMVASAAELVAAHIGDEFRSLDYDFDALISSSEFIEKPVLPQSLQLLDGMLATVLNEQPTNSVLHGAGPVVPGVSLSLEGLGFSQTEVLRIRDLFDAHSVDGLMDRRRYLLHRCWRLFDLVVNAGLTICSSRGLHTALFPESTTIHVGCT